MLAARVMFAAAGRVPGAAGDAGTGGEKLGQVDARTPGQLIELGTAGESVGENDRVVGGRAYGRQK
jgi:hypothetical protein